MDWENDGYVKVYTRVTDDDLLHGGGMVQR
jgi:hypothetical protein